MKQGWEIKKLGEVASLITDGDWIESRHQSENGIRLIQTGNIGCGAFKAKDDKPHYISEKTFEELGCTEIFSGDCLISRLPEPVGRACLIPDTNCRMITAVDCTVIRFKEMLSPELFVYYSRSSTYQRDINNNTTGTTRKRISRKNLEQIPIPIPPLAEQENIVAELDCLSGIIEKKKQQLKEYDALAQSIFYEMFGENEGKKNKWAMCHVGDIYKFQYGKGNKIPENKGMYPCYGSNGQVGFHIEYNAEDSPIIGHIGAYAGIVNWASGKHYVTYNGVICNLRNKDCNSVYGYYMLKSQNYMEKARGGAAQPFVSYDMLEEPIVYFPPLSLQQEFASKIEAIEKQKELIKQSIVETETLFNSRMDFYFNW